MNMLNISAEIKRRCVSLVMLAIAGCCGNECRAESVMICTSFRTAGGTVQQQYGTGVCIAATERGALILTCKHNVADSPANVWVYHRHDWHRCGPAVQNPVEDLALVETDIRFQVTPLGDDLPIGKSVLIEGAGPAAHGSNEPVGFSGRILTDDTIAGDSGCHVIVGDSGGPMLFDTDAGPCVVGIVNAVEGDIGPSRRRQFPGAQTQFVSCRKINAWLVTQYGGCPNGICPIQIRPRIIQPIVGVPIGPPRIIQTIEPAPQIQRQSAGSCERVSGPPGPAGPPGRSVTRAEVESVVNAWLDANADRLRGPPGPAGQHGSNGNTAAIEHRISELERRPFRLILSSDGKIVDDESYQPGEPVVLDLKRLRSVSDGK